jgi:RimJ/RimL family protein N-acetyltransferase
MRHDFRPEGRAFRLRPVELKDAGEMVRLRIDPRNARFLNATSSKVEDQENWMRGYFERAGDWYWVVERKSTGAIEGLIAIYDHDPETNAAEWGRWIIREGSSAAVESALLIYRAAFNLLHLDAVYCRTLALNEPVVSFHDSMGAPRIRTIPKGVNIRGVDYDQVEHMTRKDQWPTIEPKLAMMADRIAKMLERRPA